MLDLESLVLDIEAKAYIQTLINFKHRIINDGFTPISASVLSGHRRRDWIQDDTDHVKFGGLILCSRPKQISKDIPTEDQLEAIAKNLASTLKELAPINGVGMRVMGGGMASASVYTDIEIEIKEINNE